ncbi:Uncharacterised protein [Shewanella putrefaciens]|nr:Uncharacterised protein [Shewanella putrefaciens]
MDTQQLKAVPEQALKKANAPPENNRLLNDLPDEVKQRIFPHLELV